LSSLNSARIVMPTHQADSSMPFLQPYVDMALAAGAPRYSPPSDLVGAKKEAGGMYSTPS